MANSKTVKLQQGGQTSVLHSCVLLFYIIDWSLLILQPRGTKGGAFILNELEPAYLGLFDVLIFAKWKCLTSFPLSLLSAWIHQTDNCRNAHYPRVQQSNLGGIETQIIVIMINIKTTIESTHPCIDKCNWIFRIYVNTLTAAWPGG